MSYRSQIFFFFSFFEREGGGGALQTSMATKVGKTSVFENFTRFLLDCSNHDHVPRFLNEIIEWCMLHVSKYIQSDTTLRMLGSNFYIMSSICLYCSIDLYIHSLLKAFL